jgi:cytoplasmic iron level regulating protein YaaA (DUF328/UPF0246 family)
MKVILSPAKKLNEKAVFPEHLPFTEPVFKEKAESLITYLRKLNPGEIAALMGISEKLAKLNYERFRQWNTEGTMPAVWLYAGDTYRGLDINTFPLEKIDQLQEKVSIISGLYGILRPLDLIMPYRLEMKTPLKIKGYNDLKDYWREEITNFLKEELKGKPLVNLASVEYAEAIDKEKLDAPFVQVDFKENKDGKYKIIGLLAKRARGAMARWIAENDIDNVEELKAFSVGGYRFSDEMSSENHLVFVR